MFSYIRGNGNRVWAILLLSVSLMLICIFLAPQRSDCMPQKLVKILVTSPHIGNDVYRPVADVMAGCIIRELNRHGGLEIIDRKASEKYLRDKGLPEWVNSRDLAIEVGNALGADIVIYSSLGRNYNTFVYSIAFIEVERDIIQRILHGNFSETDTPAYIGRIIKLEMSKLINFIPLPSELNDPGAIVREETVNPDNLPREVIIENFPNMGMYGIIEQIMTYFRVFPGEVEFMKFQEQRTITRFDFRDDMD